MSTEERSELARSTKKLKSQAGEVDHSISMEAEMASDREGADQKISYKAKLTGVIPGAFEKSFYMEQQLYDDVEEDIDEFPDEKSIKIFFSREEKIAMRKEHALDIIIKLFGKSVDFYFLHKRLQNLWKLSAGFEIMDLGCGYFKVSFHNRDDLDKVLRDGPWFIGSRFLTMRLWEPKFQPAQAKFTAVAVWIRLPGLPTEYYKPRWLEKIGNNIGPLLRVDTATINEERGKFARLCMQVNLTEPLHSFVRIDNLQIPIIYEGITSLCFNCGVLGHKDVDCDRKPTTTVEIHASKTLLTETSMSNVGRRLEGEEVPESGIDSNMIDSNSNLHEDLHIDQQKSGYGPWMVVSHRKRPLIKKVVVPRPVTASSSADRKALLRQNQGRSSRTVTNFLKTATDGGKDKAPSTITHTTIVDHGLSKPLLNGLKESIKPIMKENHSKSKDASTSSVAAGFGVSHKDHGQLVSTVVKPLTNIPSSSSTKGIDIGFKFPVLKTLGKVTGSSNALSTVRARLSIDNSGNPPSPTNTNSVQTQLPVRERSRSPSRIGLSRDGTIVIT